MVWKSNEWPMPLSRLSSYPENNLSGMTGLVKGWYHQTLSSGLNAWHCFRLHLCDPTQQRAWVTPSHSREMQTVQPLTKAAHGASRDPLHQDESRETLLHPSWAENSHQASTSQTFLGLVRVSLIITTRTLRLMHT